LGLHNNLEIFVIKNVICHDKVRKILEIFFEIRRLVFLKIYHVEVITQINRKVHLLGLHNNFFGNFKNFFKIE